jgi:hypothetical protein
MNHVDVMVRRYAVHCLMAPAAGWMIAGCCSCRVNARQLVSQPAAAQRDVSAQSVVPRPPRVGCICSSCAGCGRVAAPSDALQRLGISTGPPATEEAGHAQAALMAALLTTTRKSIDVPRQNAPAGGAVPSPSAAVGVSRSRTTAGLFGSLSVHRRGSSDRASLRSGSGGTIAWSVALRDMIGSG